MDWIADPTVWVGLLTLIALEIVLGIDNLVFIAILSDKLAPEQRQRARLIGLSLALVMRLAMLAGISWIMSLSEPVLSFSRFSLSWRDLILIVGGMFLLVKATTEIHERVEGGTHKQSGAAGHAAFWPVVTQIVALDLVFSLDSVITAVGMVDELFVMMTAVVVAVGAMLLAARPLTAFINARPTLIVLCLSFLLMIGLVLVVDGLGLHVPKGYVYAAMGFSILVETLNQLASRKAPSPAGKLLTRQQVADAVLRLLGGTPTPAPALATTAGDTMFGAAEQHMVGGVLGLAERPLSAIMTPASEVVWLDPAAPDLLATLQSSPHREFPVGDSSRTMRGIVRKEDVLAQRLEGKRIDLDALLRPAPTVSERASVLETLAQFKRTTAGLALVVDERGNFRGLVTRTDLLEAIAGEFPDEGE